MGEQWTNRAETYVSRGLCDTPVDGPFHTPGQSDPFPWHDDRVEDLGAFLSGHAPFDALDGEQLTRLAGAARTLHVEAGAEIIDAFVEPTQFIYMIVEGEVDLWNSVDLTDDQADERLGAGGVFGFSALLTQRTVGPRAVAVRPTTLIALPASAVTPAFSSVPGARFLATHLSESNRQPAGAASYGTVDELIVNPPVIVGPATPIGDVARRMTEGNIAYAAVEIGGGRFGLITDSLLRKRVIVDGMPTSTPAGQVMQDPAAVTRMGESAAEALITMLDHGSEFLLVTDRAGRLRGAVTPSDFAVSPTTATVALRQQVVQAHDVEELVELGQRAPSMVVDLLSRGLATSKVLSVYSATVDAVVRRALVLTFAKHPDLTVDAFTWLSLGSNGRREAVLSSDVDSAVAFDESIGPDEQQRYRTVFGEVDDVLAEAGFGVDTHGATAARKAFARTNSAWRAAGEAWLADPVESQGAIMTSLLVDGRPIHGDPGLPAVTQVFGDLRRHEGTMRLLLTESLSQRAKLRSVRDVLARRGGTFDIKSHALVPVINIARWAALSVGSAELSTVERLRASAGSAMLPDDQANTLIEVFETMQRTRLRYQLAQRRRGKKPLDVITMQALSPIDRSVISQAVREVSGIQRRMENIAQYVPTGEWARAPRN